jgi:putative hydrolase of the HAD superfamily
MATYKNLFIDLDDTLWDTYANNKECLGELYADYHFDRYYLSFEAFFQHYMGYNLELWASYRRHQISRLTLITERFLHILRPAGIHDPAEAVKLNQDFLDRTTSRTLLIDGAIELLDYLRPSYKICALSNGFREVQFKKLNHSGMSNYFQHVILSEDAGIQKPHRGIFDYALRNTNSRRQETLMIGDSWEADIEGARLSHIDQLWFNPQSLPAPTAPTAPTYTVQTLSQIQNLL